MFEDIAAKVKTRVQRLGLTTFTAESLTGGLVSNAITAVSGSSEYHYGGVCAYNLDMKVNLLKVDRQLAAGCNCVSKDVAEQMAVGALELSGATIGIATTGYVSAWPEGGVEAPFAWYSIAIYYDGKVHQVTRRVDIPAFSEYEQRAKAQEYVAYQVLTMLYHYLFSAYILTHTDYDGSW
jgi:PncC family amidohydrolase